MGSFGVYECDTCVYRAQVSGGEDRGFIAVVQTMTCGNCHQISDVIIGVSGEVLWPDRLDEISMQTEFPVESFGACAECGSKEVKPWPKRQPCPKCEGKMESAGPIGLWD